MESFVSYIPNFYFFSKYSYTDLDPVFFQISNVQDLFDVLPKEIDAVLHANGNMIYVLKDNKITGLNMEMYGFFDFDRDEIIRRLYDKCTNQYDDSEGKEFIKHSKIFPNFPHLKRYLIVLDRKSTRLNSSHYS